MQAVWETNRSSCGVWRKPVLDNAKLRVDGGNKPLDSGEDGALHLHTSHIELLDFIPINSTAGSPGL